MFENDKELLPAIKKFGIDILRFDFNENYLTLNNISNDIDTMYYLWKQELLKLL